MAAAARALMDVGMDTVAEHEAELTAYALSRLRAVPAVRVYGAASATADRVGVITFNVEGVPHALVAAVLGYEGGIGVRSGCFCAQPYVARLLGLSEDDLARSHRALRAGDRSERPGMVRISLGIYNTRADLDAAIDFLEQIARGACHGRYRLIRETAAYEPIGYEEQRATRQFAISASGRNQRTVPSTR
jgi:selenocysteine lyase/cysteine desulfurase